jgi:hypothetical protein
MSMLFYLGLAVSIALMTVLICAAAYSYCCEGSSDYAVKEDESLEEREEGYSESNL